MFVCSFSLKVQFNKHNTNTRTQKSVSPTRVHSYALCTDNENNNNRIERKNGARQKCCGCGLYAPDHNRHLPFAVSYPIIIISLFIFVAFSIYFVKRTNDYSMCALPHNVFWGKYTKHNTQLRSRYHS